ncbi:hypothetical protein DOW39_04825 [Salmonella enterica subsp. enterica serovar Tanger]|nr:hypothetical protein [Salmonella enterica subsp. enterica serovar Tanger]EBV4600994.1 hypothetical protein [Salmonella enterica subsp. enterica serovar Tanger]
MVTNMDESVKKAFEELQDAIAISIAEKYENENLSVFNLDVMAKAKKFSSLSVNSKELFSILIETVTELEATKLALKSSLALAKQSELLIEKYKETDIASDEFKDIAVSGIFSMGDHIDHLSTELKKAPHHFASSGGKGKSQKYDVLKKRVIELYEAKKWNSPREAAQKIEADIIELSKEAGVPLSGSQPWETIHKWILKHIKN